MSKGCRATRPTAWIRRAFLDAHNGHPSDSLCVGSQSWRNTIWCEPASFLHQRFGNYAIWCADGFICNRTEPDSNRIHQLLDLQNVKLSSVLGKMTGATARSILEGLAPKR